MAALSGRVAIRQEIDTGGIRTFRLPRHTHESARAERHGRVERPADPPNEQTNEEIEPTILRAQDPDSIAQHHDETP
jgi:hypothetical protein